MDQDNNIFSTKVNVNVTNATMAMIFAYVIAMIISYFLIKKLANK